MIFRNCRQSSLRSAFISQTEKLIVKLIAIDFVNISSGVNGRIINRHNLLNFKIYLPVPIKSSMKSKIMKEMAYCI